jgi:CheY-like chemotaxis protein
MKHKPIRILIADDDPEDIELIEEAILVLQPEADIKKVSNGKAAIEYLNESNDEELPCLIVLDYNMPEINGAQVLHAIKGAGRYGAIPKVVLSTSNAPFHIETCISYGATEYWVKPDTMKGISEVAKKILRLCKT